MVVGDSLYEFYMYCTITIHPEIVEWMSKFNSSLKIICLGLEIASDRMCAEERFDFVC